MGRRAKYPTPETAVSHFTARVTEPATQAHWGAMAAEGAEKLGDWFKTAFPDLYKLIARLPAEPKDPWLERSKPVGLLIKKKKAEYHKAKMKKILEAMGITLGAGGGASPGTPSPA